MKRIDSAGLAMITKHEGVRLKAYQDSGKVWTIGYGHTAGVVKGMRITQPQAIRLLQQDVERFETCVMDNVRPELTQGQYNAVVSYAFNRGCGGLRRSSLLDLINARRFSDAARTWLTSAVTVKGKTLRGLVRRRKAEAAMFAEAGNSAAVSNSRAVASWMFGGALKAAVGRV